jgi:hypothetical protein
MDIIDRLEQYYDIDTRKGLCNMILEYVYEDKIEDMPEPSYWEIVKSMYFLTIGRITHPTTSRIYVDIFNAHMGEMED